MSSFSFRQRVGHLNWKAVSSLDIENIIDNADVVELQTIVDIITFSDFTRTDVKENTVDSVAKLVNIMQLTIEYLLYCQEAQYRLLQVTHEKNNCLRKKVQQLKKENVALAEDSKIYQHQLSMLKQSLAKSNQLLAQSGLRSDPRIVLPEAGRKQAHDGGTFEIMIQHEKETRAFLQSLLEDQRSAFLVELSKLSKVSNEPNNNNNSEETMRRTTEMMCSQIQKIIATTMTAINESNAAVIRHMDRPSQSIAPFSDELPKALKQIELLELSLSENQKRQQEERARWETERNSFMNKVQDLSALSSLSAEQAAGQMVVHRRQLSLRSVALLLSQGKYRHMLKAFRKWREVAVLSRQLDMTVARSTREEIDQRLAEKERMLQEKEREVHSLREKLLLEQARHKTAAKQWEEDKRSARLEREAALERESSWHQQEQQRLRNRVNVGTMTVVDDSLMRLQGLLIGIPDSEERLMRDAEERILQRIGAQDEVDLMNSLANEISHRIRQDV